MNDNRHDFKNIRQIVFSVQHALIGEVIPDLRAVTLIWDKENSIGMITFYHDGVFGLNTEKHYNHVTEISAKSLVDKGIRISNRVVRLDFPDLVPKNNIFAFHRKEPFQDPSEEDSLKAHEAYLKWKEG